MSFTSSTSGTIFHAAQFLVDDEACLRETATISASHLQKLTRGHRTIVPAGAIIPANGSTAVGILYEDIDVTDGDAAGSIITKGTVYEDRLPAAAESDAKSALTGITFVTAAPAIHRPAIFNKKLDALTVGSAAGTNVGDTKLTVSGHTLGSGESYVYKTGESVAPAVNLGDDLTAWTSWNGSADITATTSHKITVAVKDSDGKAVAAGSTTVTSKANG